MRRLLSLFLVCVMVMGVFGIVPVAAEGDSGYVSGDINFFSSFSGYNDGYAAKNVMPEGFINISAPNRCAAGIGKVLRGASNAVKLGPDKELVLPFNTNFLDGYMHISFDYMQTNEADTNTGRMLRVLLSRNDTVESSTNNYADLNGNITVYDTTNNVMNKYDCQGNLISEGETLVTWNQNEFDYTKITSNDSVNLMQGGSYEANVARTLYSGANKLVGVSDATGTANENYSTKEDTWYKVDMFFDRSDNRYYVYVDGVLQDYNYFGGLTAAGEEDVSWVDMSSAGKRALKALILRCDHLRGYNESAINSGNTNGYVYLDNVYVSQYTANDCTKDALKLTADTMGEIITTGSKMNIAFSEYLSTVPTKDDIVITDSNDTPYTDFTVVADNTQATITFNGDIPMNDTYTLTVNNVTGAASQSTVSNSVEFSTLASTSAATTNYYYADEDFEALEDGAVLPNWYYGDMNFTDKDRYNRYYMGEKPTDYNDAVKVTKGGDNSKAIELSGSATNDMYYFFPKGVASGEFKAEFDIKHENGGWTFGFVNYEDYNAIYNCNQYGRIRSNTGNASAAPVVEGKLADWQTKSFTNNRLRSSILIGMSKNNYTTTDAGAVDSDKRAFSPNLGMIGQDSNLNYDRYVNVNNLSKQLKSGSETDYVTLGANTWSKVEIDVNDNSKVYIIKITPYNADGSLNNANAQIFNWTDEDSNRYLKGIMGLHFSRNTYSTADLETYNAVQTGNVSIDNVKVYKTSTSYLNEDFDDYKTTGTGVTEKPLPSGWRDLSKKPIWWEIRYADAPKTHTSVTSSAGKDYNESTNAGDKAMFLYYAAQDKSPAIYKSLDKPVPAGEPFVVEFDVYNKGKSPDGTVVAEASPWMFMQMGKEDTHELLGYNYGRGISKNGKAFIAPETDITNGPDAMDNLVNDTVIAGYKPYTDADTGTDKTVADTYARINGNKNTMNVVFGRNLGNARILKSETGRFDAKRGFHGTQRYVMDDKLEQWVNYKVLCEPVSAAETKYTITQTDKDGVVTTATFTNSRDWFTQDTYAVGFAVPFKNKADITGDGVIDDIKNLSDGSCGTMIDNLKVYAAKDSGNKTESIAKNQITGITAKSASEDLKLTDGIIPEGTTSIDISFSAPVSEKVSPQLPAVNAADLPEVKSGLSKGTFTGYFDESGNCYTDYTSVLDSIEDVISMRKVGSQLEAYSGISLSEDGKTVSLSFAAPLSSGDKYILGVSSNISFEGDGYARLDKNFVESYSVSGEFTVEEPTEDTEQINFTKLNATVWRGTADIEVDKAGLLVPGEDVKIWTTTENTTDADVEAFVGYAFYNEDASTHAKMLSSINTELLNIVKGTERTEGTTTTIQVPNDATSFKAFSWSYPNMVPYVEMIKAQVE